MMELSNHLNKLKVQPRSVLETFALLLSPFAPHLGEELWRALGHEGSLAYEAWPKHDPELAKEDEVEVPVQVNGKLKARLMVPPGSDNKLLEEKARADEKVAELLEGKELRKVIVVPGKLVNFVVK